MLELKQIESFFPEHLRHFKRNLLREYLQYKILDVIFNSKYGRKLVFMGGTAIHIVHGLPRFSEDLDFDNRALAKHDFKELIELVEKKLALEGYIIKTDISFKKAFSAGIKVKRVLFNEGLSGHRDENILIKIDTQPQDFVYPAQQVILNKFDIFTGISVVPADTLLAQKFYAVLCRKRVIGRDIYDIIYLSGRTDIDFAYLEKRSGIKNKQELKSALIERCSGLNFKSLTRDIEQFVFVPGDAKKISLFMEYIKKW